MATAEQLQLRRGTAAQVAAFTGAQGEIVVDTTNNRVVVQDGATAGGFAAAKLTDIPSGSLTSRTPIADTAYTVVTTDRIVAYTALTGARVVTLCAASTYPTGVRLVIVDESGQCSPTRSITVARAGTDTIDGATSFVITTAYGCCELESDSTSKWTVLSPATNVLATGGTIDGTTIGGTTPAPGTFSPLTTSSAAVTGGTVNGTPIGGTTPAAGSFTTISASGAVSGAGFSNFVSASTMGFVNKFRNGTMAVWQRGATGTATTAGAFGADGWFVLPVGASVPYAEGGGAGGTYFSLQVSGATGVTGLTIRQRIESYDCPPLSGKTVTIQAWLFNSTGGAITPTLTVRHPTAQDNYASTVTDVNAVPLQSLPNGGFSQVAYTYNAPAQVNGIEVTFDFGNNLGASGKSVAITNCDIRATPGIAVGLNNSPPPSELRPIGIEMPFCQRYYEQVGTSALGFAITATQVDLLYRFAVTKRVAPTMTGLTTTPAIFGQAAGYITGTGSAYSFNIAAADVTGFGAQISGFTGLTAGQLVFSNQANIIGCSAEL